MLGLGYCPPVGCWVCCCSLLKLNKGFERAVVVAGRCLDPTEATTAARLQEGLDAVTQVCQQLQAAGQSLTAFAIHVCNNPDCSDVSGPSKAQLVVGHSCVCSACHTARYCGRACQRQHWQQHKPVCKALAAAQAAAKAAGAKA